MFGRETNDEGILSHGVDRLFVYVSRFRRNILRLMLDVRMIVWFHRDNPHQFSRVREQWE